MSHVQTRLEALVYAKSNSFGSFDSEESEAVLEDGGGEGAEADAAFAGAWVGFEEGNILVEGAVGLAEVIEVVGHDAGAMQAR